jgi:hypothetical protein
MFEKISRHFSDVQTDSEILPPQRLPETQYESGIFVQGRSQGRQGGLSGCKSLNPQNRN